MVGLSIELRIRLELPQVATKVGFIGIAVTGVEGVGMVAASVIELGVPIAN